MIGSVTDDGKIHSDEPIYQKSRLLKRGKAAAIYGDTRRRGEGTEKVPRGIDNRPATKQQEKLIKSIAKNFPETKESIEYADYESEPTKANASEFLSYFEENYADKAENMKGLVRYFAERPGVEKLGAHGLFSQTDDKINLDEAADEVNNHNGVVWTHVLSLRREDAERIR